MINVRPTTISDVENIVRVQHAAVHGSAPSTYYTQDILEGWSPCIDQYRVNRLRRAIENNEELLVVAETSENAVIVGFGSVIPSKQELRAVYVDPAFGRQGIGSKILANLEELALFHGADRLDLDASLNAEEFYCRHGYSVIERGSHRLSSGIVMDCIKMSKKIRVCY